MTGQTIAAGFARSFLTYAVEQGAERRSMLAAGELCDDDLSHQDNRIAIASYQRMIGAAIAQTGDTALLLRHTLASRLETMSVVGQIVHSSASLRHSIEQLNRYLHLMGNRDLPRDFIRFELARQGGGLWIVDHLILPDDMAFWTEISFARFISEFRRSFPDTPFEVALEVTYPPPPHADQYPALFRVPVRFNAPRNALRIDPVWDTDESPFEPGNSYAFGLFTDHADKLLAALDAETSVRAEIETRILPRLHEGTLSMDRVSRELGMSRQTLYRRLKGEGVTFAQIHDDLRRRMALDYIGAQRVTVNETAYLLGFSEASSFVRAFKRWTGLSPTAYLSKAA